MDNNDQDKESIDRTLLDRIFLQIDTNTSNISELTRITGEHSSSISILKKILLYILLFIIVSSLSMFFVFTESKIKNISINKNSNVEVIDKENDKGN